MKAKTYAEVLLEERMGFIGDDQELDAVINENPLTQVIIRANVDRYMVDARNVRKTLDCKITENNHLRDISIAPKQYQSSWR
jgi:hypothetical protein